MSSVLEQNIQDSSLLALLRAGRIEALRERLEERVTADPQDCGSLARLGLVELEMGAVDDAAAHADRALGLSPADTSAALALGTLLLRQRRFERVVSLCREALEKAPRDAQLLNLLGRAHNNAGALVRAREAFERAIECDPENAEVQHNLGHVFRRLGDSESAGARFGKALEIAPDHLQARLNLGTLWLEQEDYEQAGRCFRKVLELSPEHPSALAYLGLSLFRQGRPDEAETRLRKCLTLAPGHAEATLALAMLLQERGEAQAAVEAYRQLYDPGRPDPYLAARLALALHEAGHEADAAGVAESLLQCVPARGASASADDFMDLAQVMRSSGRVDLAIRCYRAAVSARPAGAREHLLLAGALVQDGQEEEALRVIEQSLRLRPGYQSAIALKITALRRAGRESEAQALQDLDAFIAVTDIAAPEGYASIGEFNEALARRVLSEPSLKFERAGHATRKGRHTDTLDIDSDGPFRDLAKVMSEACARHMHALPAKSGHPFLGRRPKSWRLQMWSVVMDSQGHQVPHTHNDGYLSGVYYPLLPDSLAESGDKQAGWIEFGRPVDELAGKGEPDIRRICPRVGRLVVFPSYFVHSTVPFESDQPRISIAFDLVPLEWLDATGPAEHGAEPATDESKYRFLEHFGANEIEHSDHDLLRHLKGVRDVLVGWGERQILCDAGLFHSVYGTESFSGGAIPVNLRGRVRQLIGLEAERLAWLFGAMRKGSFYANLRPGEGPFRVQSRLDEEWQEISQQELSDLVCLTVANWFEQLPRVSAGERERMRDLFLKMRPWLGERAQRDFDSVYAPLN